MRVLFSWVHLSDIQHGHGDSAGHALVMERLREDIAEAKGRECPTPEAILVTGDVAFSGSAAEYAAAREWLGKVGEAAGGVGAKNMFVVPGNHDVERSAGDRNAGRLIKVLREGLASVDEALAEDRALLGQRQAGYLEFAAGLAAPCGGLFWVHRFEAPGGLRVRLVGLNTALLCEGDKDKGKLRLGNAQLAEALGSIEAGELVVVLSHHPFRGGWLADEDNVHKWISNHAHIHLFGHADDAESEAALSGAGGQFVRVAGGRAHADKGPHGYSIAAVVEVDGKLALRLWPRRWSDKNKEFRSDVDGMPSGQSYAEHILRLPVARTAPPPSAKTVLFEGPGGVPISEVQHFLGRDHEMADLHAALAEDKAICVVATGLGGIGKTSLVRQFVATGAATMFPDGSLWIDAMTLPSEAARAAQRFGWSEARPPTVEEAARWLAKALHDKRVLVVIDNVDPARVDVTALPIAGGKSRTVLTSRAPGLGESLGRPARSLALGRWSDKTCRTYLRDVVPELVSAADAELDALTKFVGRLPLAVRLVARALARPGATPAGVLARLQKEPLGTLDKVATGADRGVAATFKAAYEELDEAERRVLLALAACARVTGEGAISRVTGEVMDAVRGASITLVAGMGADMASEALEELAERSLVECVDAEARLWTLHDVVRLFVRRQEGIDTADEAHLAFATRHVESHPDPTDWQAMEAEMHEVLAALDRLLETRDGQRAAKLVNSARDHLMQRGRYAELMARYTQLVGLLPEGSVELAIVLGNLGLCCWRLGDVPRAIDHHQRSLAINEKLGRLEGQAADLGNLGLCYAALGDVPRAIDHHQRSLAIEEKLGRLEGQAADLGNLGLCYRELGDVPTAIDHLQRSLAIEEKLGRLEGQAKALGNLGLCYRRLGDVPRAIDHHQRSLAINEKLGRLGGQANQLANLGLCYETLGDVRTAIDHHQRSLALYRRIGFPEDHNHVRFVLEALARLASPP